MLKIDIAVKQLNKYSEEVCGDTVEVAENGNKTIVVLSDGLGSGIKANILSTLTTRIITTMLKGGCSITDVTDSLNKTLPVCKVRKIAYSTFSVVIIDKEGNTQTVEYDNPPIMWFSNKKIREIPLQTKIYSEKMEIKEGNFKMNTGDYLVLISDGVVHAGIGGMWNLGWGWDRVVKYIEDSFVSINSAEELAQTVIDLCKKLYMNKPGDDSTVVALQLREERRLIVMIGPPKDKEKDEEVVNRLVHFKGRKVVCGGTTANIVARITNKSIDVLLDSSEDGVPPIAKIDGIDLVTEGVLTLAKCVEYLKSDITISQLKKARNGAEKLAKELLMADRIEIHLGQAINPAHQNPNTPIHLGIKFRLIEELKEILEKNGKEVNILKY